MQLLFCNTFSYDSQRPNGNWAVIKFPCMIAVEEIRIIPPGVKAHPQLHDNQFIGKTSPNKFQIRFFSDDRSASMTTYEVVGSLDYMEGSLNRFRPATPLYSEKLLLNGWFSHITVAVYGSTLSEIGASTPSLNLNAKTPSLIIHEKPEGRSVYIGGTQDIPQLTKELDKPEPLMASFPSGNRNYPNQEENFGRRDSGCHTSENLSGADTHSTYYNRRHERNRSFEHDNSRVGQKNYVTERVDYNQRMGVRKTLLPDVDPNAAAFRTDSDRLSYKEKNRTFSSSQPRFHARQENNDSENSQKIKDQTNSSNKRHDVRSSTASQGEVQDLRQNLEQRKGDNTSHDRERSLAWMQGEYEEISDEETEEERLAAIHDIDEVIDDDVSSPSMCFNPFLMEPVQLMHFAHPAMSEFEISCSNLLSSHGPNLSQNGNEEDLARFESLLTKAKKIGKLRDVTLVLDPDEGKEWVAVSEEIIPLIDCALPSFAVSSREKYDDYLSLMVTWVFTGLDINLASRQAIGTNLRMLKCGVNLAHKLCLTTQDVVVFLSELKLDEKLIDLLHVENMASSIKIMLIHALDAYLSWPSSISVYFLAEDNHVCDSYSRLVRLVMKPQASRVATALSRLMNKLSVFHAMWKLKSIVQVLVSERIPSLGDQYDSEEEFTDEGVNEGLEEDIVMEEEEEMVVMSSTSNDEDEEDERRLDTLHKIQAKGMKDDKASLPGDGELAVEPGTSVTEYPAENSLIPLGAVMSMSDVKITERDLEEITECVGLISHALENVKTTIAQLPKRSFPTSADLSGVSDKSAKSCIFRMLEFYQILPSIQALLCSPVISGNEDVFEIVYKFLDFIMSRQDGLLYLSSNSSCVNCISKHLLSSSSNLSACEIETSGTALHLGAKLAFHIQCMQCVDHLHMLPEAENAELESSDEAVEVLKVLYSLTFPTFGKYWVAAVLSLEENISPLLAHVQQVKQEDIIDNIDEAKATEDEIEPRNDEKTDGRNKKKTVRKNAPGGFAVGILLNTLKVSRNVGYLLRHRQEILQTMKGAPMGRYIEEVHEWLRPLEKLQNESQVIAQTMEFLKGSFAKLEWNTLMTSGPGLCTGLRILSYLTDATVSGEGGSVVESNMATCETALQFFAGGGLSVFVDGIEQLNKCFEYPCYSQHALTTLLSFNFHNLISDLSESLLDLTSYLLNLLLKTEDGKFQPGHLAKLLVHHYAGMYTILRESGVEKLDNITKKVVSIFGIFFGQSLKNSTEDDKDNHAEKILEELVSNMLEQCSTVVPTCILLSHLLPMPLPLSVSGEALDESTEKAILAQRQLWERSVNSILDKLLLFIPIACHSLCIPLLEVLIPLLQQLIDLSPSFAVKIIESILTACSTPDETTDSITTQSEAETRSDNIMYSFNPHPIMVLSEVSKSPTAKVAILHSMQEKDDSLNVLWKASTGKSRNSSPHLLGAAVRLASSLLDPDNVLFPHNPSQNGLNALSPTRLDEIINCACEGLKSQSVVMTRDCLSCLRFLATDEFCFKSLKTIVLKDSSLLYGTCETILNSYADDTEACAALCIAFCTLLHQLSAPEEGRAHFFTKSEIRTALKWTKDTMEKGHPFVELKVRLEETNLDDDLYLESLDEITSLYQSLMTPFEWKHKLIKGKRKKEASCWMPVNAQFKQRPLWVHSCSDNLLSVRHAILEGNLEYSFMNNNIDPKDRVKVNLTEMAEKTCPGFNLEGAFKQLTESAKTTDIDKIRMEAKAKRLKKLETFSTRHGKTMTYIKRSHGLLNTSTRSRGRGRGAASGRHYDLFRQRKQNTSRPPSMHVDDFIAADEEDSNPVTASSFVSPTTPSFVPSRRTSLPFKREFIPRGRGSRGIGRSPIGSRGGFSNFAGTGANTEPLSGMDKFRTRAIGSRPQDRFPRIRGRGRDPTRSFSPRDGFKPKPASWSFSPRGFHSSGFRGNRGMKSLMRIGRPLLPPPPMNMAAKWGGMPPPPRRGRGYGKPRGKHMRSFTR